MILRIWKLGVDRGLANNTFEKPNWTLSKMNVGAINNPFTIKNYLENYYETLIYI